MIYGWPSPWWTSSQLAAAMAQFGLTVVGPPTEEPITLADAKLHLRVDSDDSPPTNPDDTLIAAQLSAAREWCEGWLGVALAPQTLELAGASFPAFIELPFGPVSSIVSVTYLDEDSVEQTLDVADYRLDNHFSPPRMYPTTGTTWPATDGSTAAVMVDYVVGYALPDDSPPGVTLPWALRAMILVVLGSLYGNREQLTELKLMELPLGAQALGERYRVRMGMA